MGSGIRNRKDNDSPIIRRPLRAISAVNNSTDYGGIAADVCVPSFEQKVTKNNLTRDGVKIRLKKREELFEILIGENVIGRLTKNNSEIIVKCGRLGIEYSGIIVSKKDEVYARFSRVSR